jgi:hypothetical protein
MENPNELIRIAEQSKASALARLQRLKWPIGIGVALGLPLLAAWLFMSMAIVLSATGTALVLSLVWPKILARWSERKAIFFEARIELIKEQARANPIASAEFVLSETRQLEIAQRKDITEARGKLSVAQKKFEKFVRAFPSDVASADEFRKVLANFEEEIQIDEEDLKALQAEIAKLENEVEVAKAKHDVAMSMLDYRQRADASVQKHVFDKIRLDTALDTIQESIGRATSTASARAARRKQEALLLESKATSVFQPVQLAERVPSTLEKRA